MYRAQILLEPEQHRKLASIAKKEGRSISEVTRRLINAGLQSLNAEGDLLRQQRTRALKNLSALRAVVQARGGLLNSIPLEEIRRERDEDNQRIWRGEA
jgi:hypothetical protein